MLRKKKKGPLVREAAAAPQWAISEREHEGNPMFARFNEAFRDSPDRASYPIQIGVALPLNAPNAQGLPGKRELAALDDAEDAIVAEAGERAVLVGVITTSSMREFVLYTDSSDWIESFDLSLQESVRSHTVQVMANNDPRWDTYHQFVR